MKISKLFDNIEIKIICLLLAVVMWLYASKGTLRFYKTNETAEPEKQARITFREVPVQLTSSSQGQWKPIPDKISLQVECSTAEIATSSFQVEVRLMREDKTRGRVTLSAENVQLPEGLSFVKAEPAEIEIVQ